jgi:hypothetical protein
MVGVEMIAPVAFGESNIFVKLGKDLNTRAVRALLIYS